MVEQDSVTLRKIWRKWYKLALDGLFKEFEAANILLTPDAAIEEMEKLFKGALDHNESVDDPEPTNNPIEKPRLRFDDIAMTREAHHYAVDLFYKYFFPHKPGSQGKPRRGAPPLSTEYLDRILQLRRKGLNYVKIAEVLGQPKDRMRKQVQIAEKRYREAAIRVRELGAAQLRKKVSPN
jgi:hypothetical protein